MSEEYELKARLRDPVEAFLERLGETGWSRRYRGRMVDRRLDTPEGDLEARDEVLRVRRYGEPGDAERVVLGWKGPTREEGGFKLRSELETEVGSEGAIRRVLARLGFDTVVDAIDRRVHLYEKVDVTLRVEEYPRMDVLVEIEGEPERVEACLPELGLPRDAWKSWPLPEFVERYAERTGRRPVLAEEPDAR